MEELPEITPPSAPEIELPSANKSQRKKPRGCPFTKENAKAMQLSAAKAKKMRKEARAKMLAALTTRLDLGDELYRAMHSKNVNAKVERPNINITFEDAKPEER